MSDQSATTSSKAIDEVKNSSSPSSLPDVPDGGFQAWLTVVAAAVTLFASFGVVSVLTSNLSLFFPPFKC